MKSSDLLQRMCHAVLGNGELKAIVKARGFPAAAANPGILTGLFLTEQGLAQAFQSLERDEIVALHLLKSLDKPAPISFFSRIYKSSGGGYGTFTQRYQGVLTKVKERLVRAGVLLMSDVQARGDETKMELWRFALPVQFHSHLPALFSSPRTFDGAGDSRPPVIREKLIAELRAGGTPPPSTDIPGFHLADGDFRLGEFLFEPSRLVSLQIALWSRQLDLPKDRMSDPDEKSLEPAEAAHRLLGQLGENQWVDSEQLGDLVRVFSGRKIDARALGEAGWQVGLLAKHEADGKTWFRPRAAEAVYAPQAYLQHLEQDECVAVDLALVPYHALHRLTQVGDLRVNKSRAASLLLTPNLVRMGRAVDDALTSDVATWLFDKSPAFRQAEKVLVGRRGKTVLHQNLLIAKVTDLSLRVTLEKLLGERWISLKNDYVVFPREALSDVQRAVKKSGHVIKEVTGNER